MENTFSVKMIFHFYHSVVKAELKRRGFPKEVAKKIEEEHGKIVARAKDIGKSKLLSSYIMASYYIAMNRSTGKSAQENFEIFRDGLCASKLFHKVMGDVDSYLDPKKMPGRLKWSEDSHKRLYENDWVVDILPGNGEYDLSFELTGSEGKFQYGVFHWIIFACGLIHIAVSVLYSLLVWKKGTANGHALSGKILAVYDIVMTLVPYVYWFVVCVL